MYDYHDKFVIRKLEKEEGRTDDSTHPISIAVNPFSNKEKSKRYQV